MAKDPKHLYHQKQEQHSKPLYAEQHGTGQDCVQPILTYRKHACCADRGWECQHPSVIAARNQAAYPYTVKINTANAKANKDDPLYRRALALNPEEFLEPPSKTMILWGKPFGCPDDPFCDQH